MTAITERQLRDGRTVWLRTAGAADVPAIARLFTDLSSEAFRRRFQAGQPAPDLVTRLAEIDGPAGTVCVVVAGAADDLSGAGDDLPGVAAQPGRLLAEARYVPLGEGAAELALTVRDDYQGAGLGPILLGELAERAPASRIERLRAVVSLSNTAMLHVLAPYGWVLAEPTDECSTACLEISATGGMPGWPARSTGRRVLVEQRGWFESGQAAQFRAAGDDVRQCLGPGRQAGRSCPLVTSGHCRLAEEADVIVPLLAADDEDCAAVLDAHRRRWPERLVP
jgi:GNAT superfamily N-acetyltransferase